MSSSLKKPKSAFALFVSENRLKYESSIAADVPDEDKRNQLKKLLKEAYNSIDDATRSVYKERASIELGAYDEALSQVGHGNGRDVIDLSNTSEEQNVSSQGSSKKDFFATKAKSSNKVKENSPNDGASANTSSAGQLQLKYSTSSTSSSAKKSDTYNYGNKSSSSKGPRKFTSLKEMQNKDKDKETEKEKNSKKSKTTPGNGAKAMFFMTPTQKQEIEERERKKEEARKKEEEQRSQLEREQRLLQSFQEDKERRRRESETFVGKGEGVNTFFTITQEKINTAAITKKNASETSFPLTSGEDHISSKPILFPEEQNVNLPGDSTLLDKYLMSSSDFSVMRRETKIVNEHRDSLYNQSEVIDLSESAGESLAVDVSMTDSVMIENNNNNVYAYTKLQYQNPVSTLREGSMMDITPSDLHRVISMFLQATGLSSSKMLTTSNEKEGVIDVDKEANDLIMSAVNNKATPTKSLTSFYGSNESLVDFHRPRSSTHLFGNEGNIRTLRQWLEYWAGKRIYSKLDRNMKGKSKGKRKSRYDDDDDDDAWGDEDEDEDDQARNVACVMGPTGVGKTSAVYAFAEELGFNIIEITASELRSGAAIKKQFQEAAKSHGLKWNDTVSEKGKTSKRSKTESTKNNSKNVAASSLNLILFDEVDLEFEADSGMSSEILKMVKSTRTPIILTAEREDLPILRQIKCLPIYWDGPSTDDLEELCRRVLRPMPAMKNIFTKMSKLLSYTFDGDVRKLLNSLQLWLPTLQCRSDTETENVEENVVGSFERWLADTKCSSVYQDQISRYLKYAIEDSPHFSSHHASISASSNDNVDRIYRNSVYIPILSSIEPNKGSWRGGFKVRIYGKHFLQKYSQSLNTKVAQVRILLQGQTMPTDHVSVLSDQEIEIRIPRDTPSGVHSVVIMLTCEVHTAEGPKVWTTKSNICGDINGYVYVEHPFNKKTLPRRILDNSVIRRKPRKLGENEYIDSGDDMCEVQETLSNRKRTSRDTSHEKNTNGKKRRGSLKARTKKDDGDDEDEILFSDIEEEKKQDEDSATSNRNKSRKRNILDDDDDEDNEDNSDEKFDENDMVTEEEEKNVDIATMEDNKEQSRSGLDKSSQDVFDMVENLAHEDIKPMMCKAIEMVSKYALSTPFEYPVSKDDAPDYTMVINTPMDIGTVRQKVSDDKYTSLHAYIYDVRLIWGNCLEYNRNDHSRAAASLKYDAKVLCNAFEEYLHEKLSEVVQQIIEIQKHSEKISDMQSIVNALHTKQMHADVDEKDMITYGIFSEPLEKCEEAKLLASLVEAESKRKTNHNKRNFSISPPGLEYLNPQSALVPAVMVPFLENKDSHDYKGGSAINMGTCHSLHTLSQISKKWSDAEVLGRFTEFNGDTNEDLPEALQEESLRDSVRPMVTYLRGNNLSIFVERELDTMKYNPERKNTIIQSYMGMLLHVRDHHINEKVESNGASQSTGTTGDDTSSTLSIINASSTETNSQIVNENGEEYEDEEAEFGDNAHTCPDGEVMERIAYNQEGESIVLQKLKFKKLFHSGSLACTRRHKLFGQFVTEVGWQTAEDDTKRSLKGNLFDNSHYLNSKVSHALSVDVYPMMGKMVELEQQSDKVSISSSRRQKVTSKYPELYERTRLPEQHLDTFLKYTTYPTTQVCE